MHAKLLTSNVWNQQPLIWPEFSCVHQQSISILSYNEDKNREHSNTRQFNWCNKHSSENQTECWICITTYLGTGKVLRNAIKAS